MSRRDPIVEIHAACEFAGRFPEGLTEVRDGARPILRFRGRYYVCAIRLPEPSIGPGSSEEVVIKAIDDGGLLSGLEEEKSLALMDGPHVVALGEVLSYREMTVS